MSANKPAKRERNKMSCCISKILTIAVLVSSTACLSTKPGSVEAYGQIIFKAGPDENIVNVTNCDVEFLTDDLRGNHMLHIRCGENGYVDWYWSSQHSFDSTIEEEETVMFNNIDGVAVKCIGVDADCPRENVVCMTPPYELVDGVSTLTRYRVDESEVINKNSTFTAHGLFDFDMPDCVEGSVEFKINVK